MLVSNGTASSCYRVTENYFMSFAYPSLFSVDLDSTPTESPEAQPGEEVEAALADTGFESAWLMLLAMVLAGSGVMFLAAARRRD